MNGLCLVYSIVGNLGFLLIDAEYRKIVLGADPLFGASLEQVEKFLTTLAPSGGDIEYHDRESDAEWQAAIEKAKTVALA